MDSRPQKVDSLVEQLTEFRGPDLHDLCDAADAAIVKGGGFGWLAPPPRERMENYWRGVLLIPERLLFVARLDGVIAGSAQLMLPTSNNEAGSAVGTLTTFFVAPWARGYGLALNLVQRVEEEARKADLKVMSLDVRETQARAIQIYQQLGYERWGTNPRHSFVDGRWVTGYYYYKDLEPDRPAERALDSAAVKAEAEEAL